MHAQQNRWVARACMACHCSSSRTTTADKQHQRYHPRGMVSSRSHCVRGTEDSGGAGDHLRGISHYPFDAAMPRMTPEHPQTGPRTKSPHSRRHCYALIGMRRATAGVSTCGFAIAFDSVSRHGATCGPDRPWELPQWWSLL
ncbi:hypothetical protein MRX96_028561 [Rhipicephalus microplus]